MRSLENLKSKVVVVDILVYIGTLSVVIPLGMVFIQTLSWGPLLCLVIYGGILGSTWYYVVKKIPRDLEKVREVTRGIERGLRLRLDSLSWKSYSDETRKEMLSLFVSIMSTDPSEFEEVLKSLDQGARGMISEHCKVLIEKEKQSLDWRFTGNSCKEVASKVLELEQLQAAVRKA